MHNITRKHKEKSECRLLIKRLCDNKGSLDNITDDMEIKIKIYKKINEAIHMIKSIGD